MRRSPVVGGALKPCVFALALTLPGAAMEAAPRTRIHLALPHAIRGFDPRQSVEAQAQALEPLIHCSLMTFDAEGRLVPGVAAAAPVWKSPQVLELTLRDQLKFSDGSTLSAADVAATFQSLLDDKTLARSRFYQNLSSVKAKQRTLTFTLKEADAGFPGNLVLGILPAKLTLTPRIESVHMPVCGPYRITRHDQEGIVLEKNPYETQSPAARLQEIAISIIPDEKLLMTRLQTGELDLVQGGLRRETLKDLTRKNPQLSVLKSPGLNTRFLAFNIRDPHAGHPAVREAIAQAIDRQAIIHLLLADMATPANSLLPPSSLFHHSSRAPRTLNLARAEKILADAGYLRKGGTRLELSFKTSTDVTDIQMAKALAAQLKKIGIKLVIEPVENTGFVNDLREGRMQVWSAQVNAIRDPAIFAEILARSSYQNPKLDALLEKSKITASHEQRQSIYRDIQELVDKDLPVIALWHEDQFAVVHRRLKGYSLDAAGRYGALTQASLSDQGS